MQTTLISKRIE